MTAMVLLFLGFLQIEEKAMKEKLKRLHRFVFHSSTIFTQLVAFTALVSIVPILFISSLVFQKITNLVTEELVNSHNQLIAQYTSNLESKLYQYNDSLRQITNNTIIVNTLMNKTEDNNPRSKGTDVSTEVNKSLHLESPELRNCMIYSNNSNGKIYGSRVAMMDGATRESWFTKSLSARGNYFIYMAGKKKEAILSLKQDIIYINTADYTSEFIGMVKLDIYLERLLAPTVTFGESVYSYDVIALDSNSNIVYSSNKDYNSILKDLSYEELNSHKTNYYKDAMVISPNHEINFGLRLLFLFNNSQLNKKKADVQSSLLPVLSVVIGIIFVTMFAFTRSFSKRVEKLIHKIKVAETGDLSITEKIEGNDEIAVLDRQFNTMLEKLDTLIKKNYIQQLEKKESEFRNLQLQINPHFLYNTLETISSIAAVKGVFLICDLCEKLGGNFRYSLGKNYGEFVTVKQELVHTQNYVYIQKTRFENKFDVFYNVDPEMEDKLVLRFILQPIVENAIVHGLSNNKGKGTLEISIKEINHMLVIKIEDDGAGMSQQKVEEISNYINDTHQTERTRQGIGIRNVNQRIQLACGIEYGITIESLQGRGSCFTITLPLLQ